MNVKLSQKIIAIIARYNTTLRQSSTARPPPLHIATGAYRTSKGMHTSRGKNAGAMALVGTAVFGARFGVHAIPSNCSFRFEGYLNISEPPTWTVPAAEPFAENYTVLNEGAPFVYFGEM